MFFDEEDRAVFFTDGHKFILLISEGEGIPEDPCILQIFQKVQRAVDADTADRNSPFQQQTDIFPVTFPRGDDIFFGKRALLHFEAGDHFFDAFRGNIGK